MKSTFGVFGCGIESDGEVQPSMQAFSKEGKTAFECFLFHILFLTINLFLQSLYLTLQGCYLAVHVRQLGIEGTGLEIHLGIDGR